MTKFEDIKIPKNIKEETKKTIQKGKLIKRKNKKKTLKIASILIISFGICLGSLNSSVADNIPFLNNLFREGSIPGTKDDYTKYIQKINVSKVVNGVSFTINEIVCDGHKLKISYTIHSENKLPRYNKGFYKDNLLMNEKLTVKNGTVKKTGSLIGGYEDDYTYTGIEYYNLYFKGKKAPDKIKINFSVENIYTYSESEEIVDNIDGPFDFKFEVLKSKDTRVIDVNESKDGFTVDSIEIGTYSTSVNVRFPKKFILNNNRSKYPSISISSQYVDDFSRVYYSNELDENHYKIKGNMVYDSVVDENIYKIGYHDVNEYIIVKFENFNNESEDDIIEFKINISNSQ